MSDQTKLLRDTLEAALLDPAFGRSFYDRLFRAHPEVRARFTRNSDGAQQKMFAQKLCAVVDAMEDPEGFADEARAIAATHGGYGVTAAMYGWVGEALIATLRDCAGPEWTDEAERAWAAAYDSLSRAIIEAS